MYEVVAGKVGEGDVDGLAAGELPDAVDLQVARAGRWRRGWGPADEVGAGFAGGGGEGEGGGGWRAV